jgi:hypothetical protein
VRRTRKQEAAAPKPTPAKPAAEDTTPTPELRERLRTLVTEVHGTAEILQHRLEAPHLVQNGRQILEILARAIRENTIPVG